MILIMALVGEHGSTFTLLLAVVWEEVGSLTGSFYCHFLVCMTFHCPASAPFIISYVKANLHKRFS